MSAGEYLIHHFMAQETVNIPTRFDEALMGFVAIVGVIVFVVLVIDRLFHKENSNAQQ